MFLLQKTLDNRRESAMTNTTTRYADNKIVHQCNAGSIVGEKGKRKMYGHCKKCANSPECLVEFEELHSIVTGDLAIAV